MFTKMWAVFKFRKDKVRIPMFKTRDRILELGRIKSEYKVYKNSGSLLMLARIR